MDITSISMKIIQFDSHKILNTFSRNKVDVLLSQKRDMIFNQPKKDITIKTIPLPTSSGTY